MQNQPISKLFALPIWSSYQNGLPPEQICTINCTSVCLGTASPCLCSTRFSLHSTSLVWLTHVWFLPLNLHKDKEVGHTVKIKNLGAFHFQLDWTLFPTLQNWNNAVREQNIAYRCPCINFFAVSLFLLFLLLFLYDHKKQLFNWYIKHNISHLL